MLILPRFPQVDLQRTFTFRNSKQSYTGIPIIAANMDTTGTFEMARVLSKVSRGERVQATPAPWRCSRRRPLGTLRSQCTGNVGTLPGILEVIMPLAVS